MGLDTVELVVVVEKHFDISISNNEAEQINTVQDFANCVYSKVSMNPTARCKSQLLFYLLRKYFHEKFNINKDSFLPNARIKDLLHGHDLNSAWRCIQKDLQIELPALVSRDLSPSIPAEAKILGFRTHQRGKPITDNSVKDLIHWILTINHERFINIKELLNKNDVENIILGIVSDRSGISVNEIKLAHSITNDLGMD